MSTETAHPYDDDLKRALTDEAMRAGFARLGVAEAGLLQPEKEYLQRWLAADRHASMHWMKDTWEVRADPRDDRMLSGARSVVVLAAPYQREAQPVLECGRVAKYALGRDYHRVLQKRGRQMMRLLDQAGYRARLAVDSKPVFERAWAQRAGVGFVGKNCCLIVPGVGSHVFLCCVVTDAPLRPDAPMTSRCGRCTLCLDQCPTGAFVEPGQLDANRCISYLTIEHRGPIAREHRAKMDDWVFGCDVCQDVCPYNQTGHDVPGDPTPFAPRSGWQEVEVASFLEMDEETFRRWAQGSPLRRTKRQGLARNAAIALGNRGEKRHLKVLQNAARHDESEVVREAASWAIDELTRRLG